MPQLLPGCAYGAPPLAPALTKVVYIENEESTANDADLNEPLTKQALSVEFDPPTVFANGEQHESVPEHSAEDEHFIPASTLPQSLTG